MGINWQNYLSLKRELMMTNIKNNNERRLSDDNPLRMLHDKKRTFNKAYGVHVIKIFSGEWGVSNVQEEMFATILGSCVSACVHDPVIKIGGMNHFLLPRDTDDGTVVAEHAAARYGVYAMEMLINGVLKAGGQKNRLEFKLFGGGNVLNNNSTKIGSKNANFVRQFMRDEGLKIISEDLEGEQPRSVHYYPTSGKVMMRKLQRAEDFAIVEEEKQYQRKLQTKPVEGDIELF
jgi:chemotaxis protein CheD